MRGLKDRIAVVTGGASGIGRAIALRLADEGCQPAIFDIDEAGAEAVAKEAIANGGKAAARRCDITDYAAVEAAVAATEKEIGPIDFLVNNDEINVFFLKTLGQIRQMNYRTSEPVQTGYNQGVTFTEIVHARLKLRPVNICSAALLLVNSVTFFFF